MTEPHHTPDLATEVETGTGALRLPLWRRMVAEGLGTGLLVVAVVGSGIMATQVFAGQPGLTLLANSIATGGALVGLILMMGAVSGAHLNPVVSLVDRALGSLSTGDTAAYVLAQIAGACAGTMLANAMFEFPLIDPSTHVRSSPALWLSEVVATVGLLLVIHGCVRTGRARAVPFAVAAWITGAYWFTSSTSFANPAVTIARSLTDTFTGIAPSSVPRFLVAQLAGAVIAYVLIRILYPHPIEEAA